MSAKGLRHGHAPTHLREAFCDWIDEGQKGQTVTIDEEQKPVEWLFGQLWNCTDILPGEACADLDIPRGSTYAKAVRRLKAERADTEFYRLMLFEDTDPEIPGYIGVIESVRALPSVGQVVPLSDKHRVKVNTVVRLKKISDNLTEYSVFCSFVRD